MTNKKSISNLFQHGDSNIPVTVFGKSDSSIEPCVCISEYFSAVLNTVNASLFMPNQQYHFQVTTICGETFTLFCHTNKFVGCFKTLFASKAPLSVRIDVLEDTDCCCVILLKEDLE